MAYVPATASDEAQMLDAIGVTSIDDLFAAIPPHLRVQSALDIPLGVGEAALTRDLAELASRNVGIDREICFLGYGAYDHFVPAVCDAITSRSEFATAYTPYQPELSQGTLQAIFEFQTAISELAGLPVANASLYDGATAAAEAVYVCEQVLKRKRICVLRTVSEQIRAVVRTYAASYGVQVDEVDYDPVTGTVPAAAVEQLCGDDLACVLIQQPNAFGCLEDAPSLVAAADACGAVGVVSCDPLSLGVLEAPGIYGASIVVGDGQVLGNHLSFGGPSFGLFAADKRFLRRLPGRIVGQTVDADGTRAYTLTLQTREQHIRREKATSNICTNQALNALAGIVYMSWLGPRGLSRLGATLVERIARVRDIVGAIPGVSPIFAGPSFKELVVRLPISARSAVQLCKARGVHPGFEIGREYPELGPNALLIAVTERRTDADLEQLHDALAAAVAMPEGA